MKIQVFSSTPVNWEITTLWMHPGENMSLVRFIFSPSLPLSSSLFAKSHWKPTYRDFLRDNSSAICEETLKPFFTGRSRVIISLFCILRQFHCCGRMDARNTWEEDFRHEFRRHVPNDICVKSWF